MSCFDPVFFDLLNALFLRLESCLTFLVTHGWLKRVEDILEETYFSTIWLVMDLNDSQSVLIGVDSVYRAVKSAAKSSNAVRRLSVSDLSRGGSAGEMVWSWMHGFWPGQIQCHDR